MAITQTSKVIVINDYSTASAVGLTRVTGASTKTRVAIKIKSEPVGVLVDPVTLGAAVADAIAAAVANGIRNIAELASPATILRRKYAAAAIARGSKWATKRYGGGRTGPSEPDSQPGGRLFNDSGRLADGIVARGNDQGEYTINVTANRLDPSTFGPVQFIGMLARLFSLVPVLNQPERLADDPGVAKAIIDTMQGMVAKGADVALLGTRELLRSLLHALEAGAKLAAATSSQEQKPGR